MAGEDMDQGKGPDIGGESKSSGANSRSGPDPTVLTTQALYREVASLKELIEQRIEAVQAAARERDIQLKGELELRAESRMAEFENIKEILAADISGVTKLREAQLLTLGGQIDHLRELSQEKFASVAQQFNERDTRSERESRDNKVAVDAAFAAQKEAASEQNKSNTLAISKSEVATQETINKLSELFRTTTDALQDKIDDLRGRVGAMEAQKAGAKEDRSGLYAGVGAVAAVILLGIAVVGFIAAGP